MGEVGETRSILGSRSLFDNGWQELLNGFAPNSYGRRVWSFARTSRNVKVKSQRSRSPGTKTHCTLTTPSQYGRNGTASLQITSRKQQARRFDRWRGVSSPACVVSLLRLAGYRWSLPAHISSFVLTNRFDFFVVFHFQSFSVFSFLFRFCFHYSSTFNFTCR